MRKGTSFIRLVQLWGVIFIIGIGISTIVIEIIGSYRFFNFHSDRMRIDHIEQQKRIIKREVEHVVAMISQVESDSFCAGSSEDAIETELLERISQMRFGKEGYIFVNRFNGDALVTSGRVIGGEKKLWEVFDKTPEKLKEIFRKEYEAASNPDGGYIYYSLVKLTDPDKESPKASFIYGIPEREWIVGAGVYLDDVETDIAVMRGELYDQIMLNIIYFSLIAAGIVALFLFFFSRLNRRLRVDIDLFTSFFNRAALSDEPIDRKLVQFDELGRMADDANKMIADRRQAEEALRKSEAKFRGLIESSSDWIWEADADGVYTYVSPQVESILGYKPEEVLGKTLFDLMVPESSQRTERIFLEAREKGESIIALENINLHRDGRQVVLETSGVPVFETDGNLTGYRGVGRDITQRKKAEEVLQKMEKLKSVGTLAGGIAHDFNNIMMGLFGNISLARETIGNDHPAAAALGEAEKALNRSIRLTKQLLTFARGGEPVIENVRIEKLVEEVVRFDLSGSNVTPVFHTADDLWPAAVDEGQLQQVISNLTLNADHAMPGGGHLYISMENEEVPEKKIPTLKPGNYIRIVVRDEGTGIDPKLIGSIFDPYFSTKHAGSGLGLSISYSIVKQHGGEISVVSEPGKGTAFTIYLPASPSEDISELDKLARLSPVRLKTAKILVMDDEEMIRKVVSAMLERSGYAVEAVIDGKDAIESFRESREAGHPFDAVIMDLTVPGGMGGQEAVKKILEIDPQAKCIISSGYANNSVMANYTRYGFKGIIAKPYTMTGLLETLRQVLSEKPHQL